MGLSLVQSEGERQSGDGICPPHEGAFPAPSAWLPVSKGPCTLGTLSTIVGLGRCVPTICLRRKGRGRPWAASVVVKRTASRARLSYVESAAQAMGEGVTTSFS